MSAPMPTSKLQEAGLYIMVIGGASGTILGLVGPPAVSPLAGSIILFSQGFGLLLSGVGDLRDREATLYDLNIRANLDASGKILLGNGLMLTTVPLMMPLPLEDNKYLLTFILSLIASGSICLGLAQDKGNLMNWK
jgi:hypothetical protein